MDVSSLIQPPFTVFTDGGAKNNGKKSCVAAWAVYFGEFNLAIYNSSDRILIDPSNQKAELYAIRMALKNLLDYLQTNTVTSIRIVTDSQYSIDCLTKWYKNWEKNGWRTAKGDHVKHSTVIKESLAMISEIDKRHRIKVIFTHVNSHMIPPKDTLSDEYAMWYGNFMADKMANEVMSRCATNGTFQQNLGKVVRVDWDGTVVATENKADKKAEEGTVVVEW